MNEELFLMHGQGKWFLEMATTPGEDAVNTMKDFHNFIKTTTNSKPKKQRNIYQGIYIIIKFLKTNDKEKIFKASRRKKKYTLYM